MAISWGVKQRFRFVSGGLLQEWKPVNLSAVYAFTYKRDPDAKPKAHTVLYFGETADLTQETPVMKEVLAQLSASDIDTRELYLFFHPMPGSSQVDRVAVTKRLIADYCPPGNGY